jgi:hypothetical protein
MDDGSRRSDSDSYSDVDALIERAARGEADDAEVAWLAEWRRASPARERRYRDVVRLVEVARSLDAAKPTTRRPSAAEIIARAGT